MGDVPLPCRAVQFTEANSGPEGRVGGLMLPSTAQRLLAAASLSSSGRGHVPTDILREGQAAELRAGAPGQVIAAFLCLWKSNLIPPTPQKRKKNRINIYIFLSSCLKCWLSDCSIIFLTSHALLRKLFRWVSSRCLNTRKAEKCLEDKKGRE